MYGFSKSDVSDTLHGGQYKLMRSVRFSCYVGNEVTVFERMFRVSSSENEF